MKKTAKSAEEVRVERAAGRLLIRYGWPLPPEQTRRLPPTPTQSSRARAMEDPELQEIAYADLEAADEKLAGTLFELVALRSFTAASELARRLVMKALPPLEPAE